MIYESFHTIFTVIEYFHFLKKNLQKRMKMGTCLLVSLNYVYMLKGI